MYFDECEDAPANKSFAFECTSTVTGQTLVMSAVSEPDMRKWVNAIRATIAGVPLEEFMNPHQVQALSYY